MMIEGIRISLNKSWHGSNEYWGVLRAQISIKVWINLIIVWLSPEGISVVLTMTLGGICLSPNSNYLNLSRASFVFRVCLLLDMRRQRITFECSWCCVSQMSYGKMAPRQKKKFLDYTGNKQSVFFWTHFQCYFQIWP